MKKLLVAAIAILIASPAFAAVQNVKVSGDIQTTFLDRQDFSLGAMECRSTCRFRPSDRLPNKPASC